MSFPDSAYDILLDGKGYTITLTHNAAKLLLPGGTDYVLSGTDRLLLYCISSGLWTVFNV